MEQEEMAVLASNVFQFKEGLKKLTTIFINHEQNSEENVDIQSAVHECLNDVLNIFKKLLEMHPGLQSTELLLKAHNLVKHVQNYNASEDSKQLPDFINQLATAFSTRVSEYLVGDLDINIPPQPDAAVSSLLADIQKGESCSKSVTFVQDQHPQHSHSSHMTTFGVELEQQLHASGTTVPLLVKKCVKEIDDRGILVKGIYRVSGVKSKVEKLCQEFETDGENVELSRVHPNIIANVLKLYLRQLPQPLFTFSLYSEFLRFAKHWPCGSIWKEPNTAIEELRKIIMKLPKNYYCTVKVIIEHLKRVSNQDQINNMSPSNLGIVFGPTLLRTADGQSSINSLVDTVHQSRAIELVITWADELFLT